ncbi:Di-N-acetylchitobiase [Varanus komodoensis]|nr:Di-N-acetylchitobiase [Varanus komodoensis]
MTQDGKGDILWNILALGKLLCVFVFDVGGKNWKSYDWSQITTVTCFGKYDPELMCYAHSKGSRVVLHGDVSLKKIVDPAYRAAWIKEKLDLAKKQYMDGINMDIEQGVKKASAKYYALTALVKETTEKFHKEIPGSQVTFDVAWSPRCINNRCYNYSGIADSCDFMFVMSYDEWPQMWKKCIVGANAPYDQTLSGYDKYIRMGINPKKLVMGVPWYGYDYTCLDLTAHVCSFAKFPFQMLLCSSAVRSQVPYKTIMNQGNSSLSGILWNKAQKAPYLEYKGFLVIPEIAVLPGSRRSNKARATWQEQQKRRPPQASSYEMTAIVFCPRNTSATLERTTRKTSILPRAIHFLEIAKAASQGNLTDPHSKHLHVAL